MNTTAARLLIEKIIAEHGYISTIDLKFDGKSGQFKIGTDQWGIYFTAGEGFSGLFITYTDGTGTQWFGTDEFNGWSEALEFAARYGY